MRKIITLAVLLLALLTGCSPKLQRYEVTWLDAFDTVSNLKGYAASQAEFSEKANAVHQRLLEYHRLFDIYNEYPGVVNLKIINETAGVQPVEVNEYIMQLLSDCKDGYYLTDGRVNAAMGSVLKLWHETREAGIDDPEHAVLPDRAALEAAAQHIDFERVILDKEHSTVYFEDPLIQLDVGAIAKGWAAQQSSQLLPDGYLLNLGGNTLGTGAKADGTPWVIGIQNPAVETEYLCTVNITAGCAVTSGDYQRYYTVDGQRYHHIIDPDTLMPAAKWHSVTIICTDSGLADCLSTALFILPQAQGIALAQKLDAQVLWVDLDGNVTMTEGFPINDTIQSR